MQKRCCAGGADWNESKKPLSLRANNARLPADNPPSVDGMEAQRLLGTMALLTALGVAHAETREWLHTAHNYTVQVNLLRLQHSLPPLKLNTQLCAAAQAHAEAMAQTGVIAHADAHGRRADHRASEAGYFYHRLGENLAAGQLTWERALDAWLGSPSHRANLLTPDYRELGVGFTASAVRYRTVWAQLLGTRRTAYPVIINLDAYETDSPEISVYVHGVREAQAMRYRVNNGDWSAWQPPQEWLSCELPPHEGFHTITVQVQIGERVFTASDEIYLRSEVVLAQVASDGERNDARCARLLERVGAGVERATRGEHIVQQPQGSPAHAVGLDDLERIAHILHALGLTQPHLRAAVEAPTEPALLQGDA